jgi:hypothetical protein
MENNKSVTAVEWLFDKLWNTNKDKFTWYAILKQAKEMEKEQIIKAFNEGTFSEMEKIDAEQYCKETFKSE